MTDIVLEIWKNLPLISAPNIFFFTDLPMLMFHATDMVPQNDVTGFPQLMESEIPVLFQYLRHFFKHVFSEE